MHKSRLAGLVIYCQGDDLGVATEFRSRPLGCEPGESTDRADGGCVSLQTPPNELYVELQS